MVASGKSGTGNHFRLQWIACAVLFGAGVLLYGYTLSYPFVFDDHIYLVENPLVKDTRSFGFLRDFKAFANASRKMGLDPDLSTNFILRPLTYLTFHLNYLGDGMRPRGFRAVNIAIHCVNAILVFQILLHLLRASPKATSLPKASPEFVALGAALLFLVHPLQTESVTYIVQRFTSLGAFFYLLTIWLHLRANAASSTATRRGFRAGSLAALLAGMFSKEEVFTAPFMLVMLDWLVMDTPLKTAARRAWLHLLCLPIIPTMVLLTSSAQSSGPLSLSSTVNIVNPFNYPPLHYALTQLSVVLQYLRLILLPVGLNLDWEYTLSTSLWEPRVLVSATIILGLVLGSWLWYRRAGADVRVALVFASVLWYFTTLALSSSVIPLPDLMCEHRCYLATFGVFAALMACADLLRTHLSRFRWTVPTALGVWLVALSVATVMRNRLWRSEIVIWNDVVAKSPHKSRPLVNLGVAYYEQGRPEKAIECFRKAIQVQPSAVRAYQNLSRVLNWQARYQEALIVAQLGLRYAPAYEELHFNIGVANFGLGQTANSIEAFRRAVAIRPTHVRSHLCLAEIHARRREYELARQHLHAAAESAQTDPELREAVAKVAHLIPALRATGVPTTNSR